jgi:hypothetical protein
VPAFFWIGLTLMIVLAVIIVLAARTGNHIPGWDSTALVSYGGLPPGVTRSATGWYSCPACRGRPCALCAQRNWSRRRR